VTDAGGVSRICELDRIELLPTGRLLLDTQSEELFIRGTIHVPGACDRAQIQVMLLPSHGEMQPPTATVNGVQTTVAFHERQRGDKQDAWALIDVTPGPHEIAILLSGRGTGQIGAWLRAEYDLVSEGSDTVPTPQGDFFPVFASERDRRVATLLPVESYEMPLPPIPEGATVPVAELRNRCIESKVGFFHLGWDESCWTDDPALRIGAVTYNRGIGVHAPAVVAFDIDGAFARFKADVGMHGIPTERKSDPTKLGSCAFIVEGDGQVLYESPVLREGDAPIAIEVAIAGVNRLALRTTNGGDSNYDDLAAWGNARLER
jgi:hypothetical protein